MVTSRWSVICYPCTIGFFAKEFIEPISSLYTAPNQSVLYQPDQSISIRKPMFEHRLRAPNLVPFRVRKQLL